MRLFQLVAATALAAGFAIGSANGQTAVERFESKAKAPLTAVPKPTDPAAAAPTEKPYMGVEADDEKDADNRGAFILGVKKGAAAETGGLKAGDSIVAIDGKPIRNWNDVDAAMKGSKIGTKLLITVRRGLLQETKTITLGRKPPESAVTEEPGATPAETPPADPPAVDTLPPAAPLLRDPAAPSFTPRPSTVIGESPAAPSLGPAADPAVPPTRDPDLSLAPPPDAGIPPTAPPRGLDSLAPDTAADPADPAAAPLLGTGKATLGVSVVPLNAETRVQYDIRTSARQGAIIHSVRPGSPADLAGLPIGGVIVSIDGELVKSSDDLATAIAAAKPGQEVELRYLTAGDELATKPVRLAPAAATAMVPATPRAPVTGAPSNLRKFEEMADSLATDVPIGSTIADPSRVAKLYEDVKAMKEKITALEERVKLLEAKLGGEAPALNNP